MGTIVVDGGCSFWGRIFYFIFIFLVCFVGGSFHYILFCCGNVILVTDLFRFD